MTFIWQWIFVVGRHRQSKIQSVRCLKSTWTPTARFHFTNNNKTGFFFLSLRNFLPIEVEKQMVNNMFIICRQFTYTAEGITFHSGLVIKVGTHSVRCIAAVVGNMNTVCYNNKFGEEVTFAYPSVVDVILYFHGISHSAKWSVLTLGMYPIRALLMSKQAT